MEPISPTPDTTTIETRERVITPPAPTCDVDERSFEAYLADTTATDVLFISTLADIIRDRATDRGLPVAREVTPRYRLEHGKRVGIGPDILISEGTADLIEAVVMTTVAALTNALDAVAAEMAR